MSRSTIKGIVIALAWIVGIPTLATILTPRDEQREAYPLPRTQAVAPAYDVQAEATLGLRQGAGRLLTEAEWAEAQRKLWVMSPEEQKQYRAAIRRQVSDRANTAA